MPRDPTDTRAASLDRARAAFERRAWGEAVSSFTAADREAPLGLDELEMLGRAAHLTGRDDDAVRTGARAFAAAVDAGQEERAARAGFWVGMALAQRGELAQAGAWFGRAHQLVEGAGRDCVEAGYLLIPRALGQLDARDGAAAFETFQQVAAIAGRFGDPDLTTLGRLGRGQSLIAMGERDKGVLLLDDAMLSVTSGEASEVVAGIVYCAVIEACHRVLDMRRAHEWTTALSDWCAAQPDLVPYRGQCLVRRAELMRFHGDWNESDDEVRRAQAILLGPPIDAAVGEALYQQAELLRLRGDHARAERAYTEAGRFGRRSEPGLPLLRLAQGRADAAWAMIRRALDEDPEEPRLLEAAVEVALARRDIAVARSLADRLRAQADATAPELLRAMTARAEGTVAMAEGDSIGALRALRAAFALWNDLDAPYETARVRMTIAHACRALGDDESAELELEAARRVFDELGATAAEAAGDVPDRADERAGLTSRELEVLRLLAAGRTNRQIAAELGISERTIDRHVSNVYTKLDVSSRAAATAWAYEHRLA